MNEVSAWDEEATRRAWADGAKTTSPLLLYSNMALAVSNGDSRRLGVTPGINDDTRDALPYLERAKRVMGFARNTPSTDSLFALMAFLAACQTCHYIPVSTMVIIAEAMEDVVKHIKANIDPDSIPEFASIAPQDRFFRRLLYWVPQKMRWATFYLAGNSSVTLLTKYISGDQDAFTQMGIADVKVNTNIHDFHSTTVQPRSFLILDPHAFEAAIENYVGDEVDPGALSTYGYFLAGQVGVYRTALNAADPAAHAALFSPIVQFQYPSVLQFRLVQLDACYEKLHSLLPASTLALMESGHLPVTFRNWSQWFAPKSADSSPGSSRSSPENNLQISPNECFWLLDMLGSRIMLHAPVRGNIVLLAQMPADSAISGPHLPSPAWLENDMGFTKCMEAASRIARVLRAFALSCWKHEMGAVFPTVVFAIYLSALTHIINYRNILQISQFQHPQMTPLAVSTAQDMAMFSIRILEAVGTVVHSAKDFARVARLFLSSHDPPFVPSYKCFDYDELRRLALVAKELTK
ncbi:hypothetical protein M427DRAFT_354221 [Gonapodya prolifera JEL478]|uniref:Transcription factor domain-containing protein n=1 Tax=Gonapodya prolifera (strain JEL478) TaxID=1344416 RepID=A0A139AB85_GONPJ|nr:hypothetical protein M427DRAFT_354221 [Gonapodya prolifera JEL478]|eukprot:KXS14066.1 hypothetical protein M427DRAFT_354221 [Gonapodya prolifera JEL478]